jgi:DNA-directed RNA polymerase specialized sigma24 family protein
LAVSGKPRALMHRIAANLATDYERRHKVRNRYVDNVDFFNKELQSCDPINPEQNISARQRLDKLVEAVKL